jgi:hypothetical protein
MPDDSPVETHDHNGISEWCVVQETKRFAKSKSWIIFRVVNVYFKFFCDNRISYKGIFFYIIVIYKREDILDKVVVQQIWIVVHFSVKDLKLFLIIQGIYAEIVYMCGFVEEYLMVRNNEVQVI